MFNWKKHRSDYTTHVGTTQYRVARIENVRPDFTAGRMVTDIEYHAHCTRSGHRAEAVSIEASVAAAQAACRDHYQARAC